MSGEEVEVTSTESKPNETPLEAPAPKPLLFGPGAFVTRDHVVCGEVPATLIAEIGSVALGSALDFEAGPEGRRVREGIVGDLTTFTRSAFDSLRLLQLLRFVHEHASIEPNGTVIRVWLEVAPGGPVILAAYFKRPGEPASRIRLALAPLTTEGEPRP